MEKNNQDNAKTIAPKDNMSMGTTNNKDTNMKPQNSTDSDSQPVQQSQPLQQQPPVPKTDQQFTGVDRNMPSNTNTGNTVQFGKENNVTPVNPAENMNANPLGQNNTQPSSSVGANQNGESNVPQKSSNLILIVIVIVMALLVVGGLVYVFMGSQNDAQYENETPEVVVTPEPTLESTPTPTTETTPAIEREDVPFVPSVPENEDTEGFGTPITETEDSQDDSDSEEPENSESSSEEEEDNLNTGEGPVTDEALF